MQPSDCGKHWLPVEYLSHKLSAAERNYDATNSKFVAFVSGLKRWRHYLLGTHFVVRSDHASFSVSAYVTEPVLQASSYFGFLVTI